jgi:hypothetical protein
MTHASEPKDSTSSAFFKYGEWKFNIYFNMLSWNSWSQLSTNGDSRKRRHTKLREVVIGVVR